MVLNTSLNIKGKPIVNSMMVLSLKKNMVLKFSNDK